MYFKTIGKEVAVDLKSLQTELTNFNRFLHRLYMALDSIEYILSPYDALQLANDYIMIKRFKFRLNRRTVSYLDDKESKFYLNICNDIISNYIELCKLESENGGNLEVVTDVVMNDYRDDSKMELLHYNGHLLDRNLIKILVEID